MAIAFHVCDGHRWVLGTDGLGGVGDNVSIPFNDLCNTLERPSKWREIAKLNLESLPSFD